MDVLIPIVVGSCVVIFVGSFVVDRLLRRRRAAGLAERAEKGRQAGSQDSIARSEARAIENGAGQRGAAGGWTS